MPAGLDREEGRRLYTKMPPLRGCICFKRHRPAFQEITHKFVAHACQAGGSVLWASQSGWRQESPLELD